MTLSTASILVQLCTIILLVHSGQCQQTSSQGSESRNTDPNIVDQDRGVSRRIH